MNLSIFRANGSRLKEPELLQRYTISGVSSEPITLALYATWVSDPEKRSHISLRRKPVGRNSYGLRLRTFASIIILSCVSCLSYVSVCANLFWTLDLMCAPGMALALSLIWLCDDMAYLMRRR